MQYAQEEAPNPGEKRYARLSEWIGHNESCAAQWASDGIYQCVGVKQGIWLLKTMATHPLTMISRVKLLQLIYIDWLRKLIFVQICQLGSSFLGQTRITYGPLPLGLNLPLGWLINPLRTFKTRSPFWNFLRFTLFLNARVIFLW